MYTGVIQGVGPRYCPSIEDKIHRFAGKSSHQLFLEPEGLTSNEIYPNGISTSLPFDVQLKLVHSIRGLERAHIVRPGYAIEYDYFDPRSLRASLETRSLGGLFFAGQINAPPDTKRPQPRGFLRASTLRFGCRAVSLGGRNATRRTSGCWWMILSRAAFRSRIACSRAVPSIA